jgi:molybdopterin synthase sulfur carrier subunit
MAIVTLRYWAAAKEAAGIAEEAVSAGTLAEALAAASGDGGSGGADQRDERNARLRAILVRSSFLVDGTPVGTRAPEAVALGDGSVVEVLPPFAGG